MVERILGKAEVVSSILTGSTIFLVEVRHILPLGGLGIEDGDFGNLVGNPAIPRLFSHAFGQATSTLRRPDARIIATLSFADSVLISLASRPCRVIVGHPPVP